MNFRVQIKNRKIPNRNRRPLRKGTFIKVIKQSAVKKYTLIFNKRYFSYIAVLARAAGDFNVMQPFSICLVVIGSQVILL